MNVKRTLRTGAEVAGAGVWLVLCVSTPLLLALGLWLLGVPLDWGTWKTYIGLGALTLAIIAAR